MERDGELLVRGTFQELLKEDDKLKLVDIENVLLGVCLNHC